jgi:hypothetical protein
VAWSRRGLGGYLIRDKHLEGHHWGHTEADCRVERQVREEGPGRPRLEEQPWVPSQH